MNHVDIQKASLLDILFAQRNQQYGAYVLRKYYHNRLYLALGITLTATFAIFFVAARLDGADPVAALAALPKAPDVQIAQVEFPKKVVSPVEQPKTAKRLFRTEALTTHIVIEKEAKTDVAALDDLKDALIGAKKITGDIAPPEMHTVLPVAPAVSGPKAADPAPVEDKFVAHPSEAPVFPGGEAAWRAYLARMITVPGDMEAGEKRSVLVRFLVSDEGSVTGFEILRSAGASFDNEVLRVLRKMPRWKPACQNGRAVATSFQQPVTFAAPEE